MLKPLMMIILLTTTCLAQAGLHNQLALFAPGQTDGPPMSVGTSAGLPCESGFKLVGDDCEPLAEFE
ncbi:hypothetical protein LOY46_15890 [Pseudomonas sichuanensis]|uniref:Uncharacterized protein n=1 Tax=Pseudomonas oryziphila TaxID=2894079 RepID=A0ABM7CSG7_9PSED|nr:MULTISPECIES: hypothetical protein [Pseudomonas]AZL74328.1 hypothetical protein EI693_15095 [Pseudomonas oryziphila]UVK81057.1 hypothetical protein LOY46_15890 [Pseudomonas sichuanensis]